MTVPHAPAAVRAHAHYVTTREGGSGAVRELAELILAAQGRAAANRPRIAARRARTRSALTDRTMDRTRAIIDRLVAWSPVLLLGALAALTYWLDAQVQAPAARRDGSDAPRSGPVPQDFRAITFDAKGKPRETLSADARRAFPRRRERRARRARSSSLTEPGRPT